MTLLFYTSSSLSVLDLCSDLPELEIMSLLSEGQPRYTLRADSVFGYDNDDWLHTPLLPPELSPGLTYEQMEESLKYFCKCRFVRALSKFTPIPCRVFAILQAVLMLSVAAILFYCVFCVFMYFCEGLQFCAFLCHKRAQWFQLNLESEGTGFSTSG